MNPAGEPSGGERPPGPARPGLRPTSFTSLVTAALIAGVFGWWFIRTYFGDIPNLNWLPGLTLAGLGVVEVVLARSTRARIERRRGYGHLNPLLAARYAVLAKASSLSGAIFAGAYGGMAVWALSERDVLRAASQNLAPAIAGLVGGVMLAAGALLLERACRVPPPPDDSDGDTGGAPPAPRR